MTRCTPCTLCGTDHKLIAVLRLLRSTRLGLLTISSTSALSVRGFTIVCEKSIDVIKPWWEEWKWLFAAIGVVLVTIATLIKFWR